jgi:hypothetical protein
MKISLKSLLISSINRKTIIKMMADRGISLMARASTDWMEALLLNNFEKKMNVELVSGEKKKTRDVP